jgi:hypothetical protein
MHGTWPAAGHYLSCLQTSIKANPQSGRPPLIGCWWLYVKRALQPKAASFTLTSNIRNAVRKIDMNILYHLQDFDHTQSRCSDHVEGKMAFYLSFVPIAWND